MAKYKLVIEQDSDGMSPREWDNLGTMACWHTGYTLGDEQPDESPVDHRMRLVEILDLIPESYYDDWGNISDGNLEVIDRLFDEHYIALDLYLYDHSGITMNTGGFSCPWDSGQVGFIYISREQVRKCYGWERISKKREQEIRDCLESEVKIYDQYLTGDMYGGTLYKYPVAHKTLDNVNEQLDIDDLEETDSCWGFFGSDPVVNGMFDNFGVNTVNCSVVMQ